MADEEAALEEIVPRQAWPKPHELSNSLEQSLWMRDFFRENHCHLLKWPKPDLVGVASLNALALNKAVIKETLETWGSVCNEPKSPPVDWLKQEAWCL